MKRCIQLCMLLAASAVQAADPAPLDLRQVIIRALERDVIGWATRPEMSDAKFVDNLWRAVREGKARVMSDVAGAVDDSQPAEVQVGDRVWLPSEIDQDVDRLFMTPAAYREHLIGSSVVCKVLGNDELESPARISADWLGKFSPRGPLTVQWPTSWLNVYENQKVTDKAIQGWLDWRDLFEESVAAPLTFQPGAPAVIAILPPGDQMWPGVADEKSRWLDVFIGQLGAPSEEATPPPSTAQTLLLGIALPTSASLDLMAARKPSQDAALLTTLLARVDDGTARMVFAAGLSNDPLAATHATLTSARLHAYPTEMPSIPSAWGESPVGTVWESEANEVALHQDLAPPARTEWKLAGDVPEAIMWEPRFRFIDFRASHSIESGVYLLSLLHIPEVMSGPGLDAGQTILVFAKHNAAPRQPFRGPAPKDPFAAGARPITAPTEYEAEMFVFEVPAKEEADWQPTAFGSAKESDQARLQTLLHRVKAGTASLAGHVLLRGPIGRRTACRVVEEYMTATEFDPPELPNSPRMRPTALNALPVGSRWQIDIADPVADDGLLSVEHTFEHSTAKPVEPPLEETLSIARRDSSDYPGAVHHQEKWQGSLTLRENEPVCLGPQKPSGVVRDVRHVAFIRLRKL